MQSVLNFGKKDVPRILECFKGMEKKQTTAPHQLARAKSGKSTLTLFSSGKIVVQGSDHDTIKEKILSSLAEEKETMLGIDEVGRGESTGPFVVCGVLGDKNLLRELRDSKKTSKINEKFLTATKNSYAFACISFNAEFVDKLRKEDINMNKIEAITAKKMIELFRELGQKNKTIIDGGVAFLHEKDTEFLVKADDLEPVVGAASVIAKFLREQSGDKKKRESWNTKEKNQQ
ncbi:MAG: DUF3378 domain-containing protein [archaeon]